MKEPCETQHAAEEHSRWGGMIDTPLILASCDDDLPVISHPSTAHARALLGDKPISIIAPAADNSFSGRAHCLLFIHLITYSYLY